MAEEGDPSILRYRNERRGMQKIPPKKKKAHEPSSRLQTVKLYEAYVGRQDGECEGDDDG